MRKIITQYQILDWIGVMNNVYNTLCETFYVNIIYINKYNPITKQPTLRKQCIVLYDTELQAHTVNIRYPPGPDVLLEHFFSSSVEAQSLTNRSLTFQS